MEGAGDPGLPDDWREIDYPLAWTQEGNTASLAAMALRYDPALCR